MPITLEHLIYDDGEVAVGLVEVDGRTSNIAIRWRSNNNLMGGKTDWFVLPITYGEAICKRLLEQWAAATDCTGCSMITCFDEPGVAAMIRLLVDIEAISCGMCY